MNARRAAPVVVAGAFALVYVLVSPPSLDLAAHMFRAKLFRAEGFGIWNNWWYAGHHTLSYSVLFPPAAALLSPQLAAALAATATAAVFERLVHDHFGERAWLGALWLGAATATDLYTGRLAFAFGLLPAAAATLALSRGRPWLASGLGVITALCSPVAALFSGLVGAAAAVGAWIPERRFKAGVGGVALLLASLVPVGAIALAFPEGGSEPFTFAALWPIPVIAVVALVALPRDAWTLRAGVVLYTIGVIASYVISTPVGSNAVRLAALVAGPLAAMLWWRRNTVALLAAALPLLYLQWQPPVRDVHNASGDPSHSTAYYRPLLSFLSRQAGPPFRVEIPFTGFHWEAYEVAPKFPSPRGWERQLDIKYNPLFYVGTLAAARYKQWLHSVAVRFVAVSDVTRMDYSAGPETRLVLGGLPYLRPVFRSTHWRVFEVRNPTPIVTGAASLTALGPSWLSLRVQHPGEAIVRVHFTPYWKLSGGPGCVARDGDFVKLSLRRPGPVRLVIGFSPGRIGARSPRCS
jgi:hypothetical protein